jgi:HEAT repeat protein
MHDDNAVLRYWGALGCTICGKSAVSAAESLTTLLEDPVPAVRIAASEALVVQGDATQGLKALTSILAETNDDMVALEALNVVAAIGLTDQIPRTLYDRACKIGSYPGRLADDYPSNPKAIQ